MISLVVVRKVRTICGVIADGVLYGLIKPRVGTGFDFAGAESGVLVFEIVPKFFIHVDQADFARRARVHDRTVAGYEAQL